MIDRTSKRLQKQNEQQSRLEGLYAQFPQLKTIDLAIAANGRAMLRVATGLSADQGQDKERLGQVQQGLLRQRQQTLQALGLTESIYEVQWDCPLCQDRGYVNPGTKCQCALKEEVQRQRQHSGLALLQQQQTFEKFSLAWYEDQDYYENILNQSRRFADHVSCCQSAGNLLLYGSVGTGKTHLCSAVANQVLGAGRSVIYGKTGRLFTWLRNELYSDFAQMKALDPVEQLCGVDLLILDDLGTESRTDFVEEQLFNLIDERILRKKPWIISTNFSVDKLLQHYDQRLTDRILGEAQRLRFTEKSIRSQKCQD